MSTRPVRVVTGFTRTVWRHLTSMRTALILLFLLAVASLPGALLPQWYLNKSKTQQYIDDHAVIGPVLDTLGFFDVFASPWYAAIYLLVGISLIGCIAPRTMEFYRQWRAKPGRAPRNLARMPHHARADAEGTPAEVAERIRRRLRRKGIGGWRTVVREERAGSVTVSAERGYLREIGNLAFHIAVLGLLITMAAGSLLGYTGSILVTAGSGFCSSAPVSYDNFRPGRLVDGTDMTPFCVDVNKFQAAYDDNGMARYFRAQVEVQASPGLADGHWTHRVLNVNDPLRISGQRLYLLGHGYVPTFAVHYPDGQTRHYQAPFQPQDAMFTSDGVVKITDPPGYSDEEAHQIAIVGVFAPSGVVSGGILSSAYPEMLAPMVAIEVYRGDLGMDRGRPQSIFAIDNEQVDKGLLVPQGRKNLGVGDSFSLDDGTTITFTGAKEYVSLQTSYDPVQGWALVFAIMLVAGLLVSLTIKRRRVWYRVTAVNDDGHTLGPATAGTRCSVAVGGLARTDQAGYGAEFDSLVGLIGGEVAISDPAVDDAAVDDPVAGGPAVDDPAVEEGRLT